jgi:hypothetical protein
MSEESERGKKLKTKLINHKMKNKKNWTRQRKKRKPKQWKKLKRLNEKKKNTAIIEQSSTILWKMCHRYRGFNKTIKAQDTACKDAQ